jgi:hypothetical protein
MPKHAVDINTVVHTRTYIHTYILVHHTNRQTSLLNGCGDVKVTLCIIWGKTSQWNMRQDVAITFKNNIIATKPVSGPLLEGERSVPSVDIQNVDFIAKWVSGRDREKSVREPTNGHPTGRGFCLTPSPLLKVLLTSTTRVAWSWKFVRP